MRSFRRAAFCGLLLCCVLVSVVLAHSPSRPSDRVVVTAQLELITAIRTPVAQHYQRVQATIGRTYDRRARQAFDLQQHYLRQEALKQTLVKVTASAHRQTMTRASPASRPSGVPVYAPTTGSLSSVAQCIKNHESGNYAESTHPGSGSGAYQFIPSTWRTWSIRAGYFVRDAHGNPILDRDGQMIALYSYAYQAPPGVQDAVLQYALTHGGAGNWSNRFGNDPCTAGLPGGG